MRKGWVGPVLAFLAMLAWVLYWGRAKPIPVDPYPGMGRTEWLKAGSPPSPRPLPMQGPRWEMP